MYSIALNISFLIRRKNQSSISYSSCKNYGKTDSLNHSVDAHWSYIEVFLKKVVYIYNKFYNYIFHSQHSSSKAIENKQTYGQSNFATENLSPRIDIVLLECCTRFSWTLIKCYWQIAKLATSTSSPPLLLIERELANKSGLCKQLKFNFPLSIYPRIFYIH